MCQNFVVMIIVLIIVVSQEFSEAASPAALLATDLSEITISKFVFTIPTILARRREYPLHGARQL